MLARKEVVGVGADVDAVRVGGEEGESREGEEGGETEGMHGERGKEGCERRAR